MILQYLAQRDNCNKIRSYINSQFSTLFSYSLVSKFLSIHFAIANISLYLKVGSIALSLMGFYLNI